MIQFIDDPRAMLFVDDVTASIGKLSQFLREKFPKAKREEIIKSVGRNLVEQLDQMFLPIIAAVIKEKRDSGELKGDSPTKRYENFFTKGNVDELTQKFPFLFQARDMLITKAVNNIIECLERLRGDIQLLLSTIINNADLETLSAIDIPDPDFHDSRQVLILTFVNSKLVYKPTNLRGVNVVNGLCNFFKLKSPYDLYIPQVVECKEYGWMEFIDFQESTNERQIRNHFKRYGSLLAFAEAFMFSDLQYPNIICARGEYPTPIDFETLFCPDHFEKTFPINRILLVQEGSYGDGKPQDGFVASIQSFGYKTGIRSVPQSGTEGTDLIEAVTVQAPADLILVNNPVSKTHFISPLGYIDEITSAYDYCYDLISKKVKKITDLDVWDCVGQLSFRAIMRAGRKYKAFLSLALTSSDPELVLKDGFKDLEFPELHEYEISNLLKMDIPHFSIKPGQRHLFFGRQSVSECVEGFFSETASELFKKNIFNRHTQIKKKNINFIRKNLRLSQPSILRITS